MKERSEILKTDFSSKDITDEFHVALYDLLSKSPDITQNKELEDFFNTNLLALIVQSDSRLLHLFINHYKFDVNYNVAGSFDNKLTVNVKKFIIRKDVLHRSLHELASSFDSKVNYNKRTNAYKIHTMLKKNFTTDITGLEKLEDAENYFKEVSIKISHEIHRRIFEAQLRAKEMNKPLLILFSGENLKKNEIKSGEFGTYGEQFFSNLALVITRIVFADLYSKKINKLNIYDYDSNNNRDQAFQNYLKKSIGSVVNPLDVLTSLIDHYLGEDSCMKHNLKDIANDLQNDKKDSFFILKYDQIESLLTIDSDILSDYEILVLNANSLETSQNNQLKHLSGMKNEENLNHFGNLTQSFQHLHTQIKFDAKPFSLIAPFVNPHEFVLKIFNFLGREKSNKHSASIAHLKDDESIGDLNIESDDTSADHQATLKNFSAQLEGYMNGLFQGMIEGINVLSTDKARSLDDLKKMLRVDKLNKANNYVQITREGFEYTLNYIKSLMAYRISVPNGNNTQDLATNLYNAYCEKKYFLEKTTPYLVRLNQGSKLFDANNKDTGIDLQIKFIIGTIYNSIEVRINTAETQNKVSKIIVNRAKLLLKELSCILSTDYSGTLIPTLKKFLEYERELKKMLDTNNVSSVNIFSLLPPVEETLSPVEEIPSNEGQSYTRG